MLRRKWCAHGGIISISSRAPSLGLRPAYVPPISLDRACSAGYQPPSSPVDYQRSSVAPPLLDGSWSGMKPRPDCELESSSVAALITTSTPTPTIVQNHHFL